MCYVAIYGCGFTHSHWPTLFLLRKSVKIGQYLHSSLLKFWGPSPCIFSYLFFICTLTKKIFRHQISNCNNKQIAVINIISCFTCFCHNFHYLLTLILIVVFNSVYLLAMYHSYYATHVERKTVVVMRPSLIQTLTLLMINKMKPSQGTYVTVTVVCIIKSCKPLIEFVLGITV